MSIFIKSHALPAQILRFRELEVTMGLSPEHSISWRNPTQKLFSVVSQKSYKLVSHSNDLKFDGKTLLQGEQVTLHHAHKVEVANRRFTVFCTSSRSELESRLGNFTSSKFSLNISLGPFTKTYPIPCNKSIVIGSGLDADVHLSLPGIETSHCAINSQSNSIAVEAIEGEVINNTCEATHTGLIFLPAAQYSFSIDKLTH